MKTDRQTDTLSVRFAVQLCRPKYDSIFTLGSVSIPKFFGKSTFFSRFFLSCRSMEFRCLKLFLLIFYLFLGGCLSFGNRFGPVQTQNP